jgi:Cu/Zn superoxide dismutase
MALRRLAGAAMTAVAAATLAGCGLWGARDAPPPPAGAPAAGLETHFRAINSGVTGKARVLDRGDGVTLLLSMINLPPGEYRVSFNERANCTSPNGFSAGAPWAPAATGKSPRDLVPLLITNREGTAEASVHIRGLHTVGPDGVSGRSIVVYTGGAVTDARPDVPNNRIACGVFEPTVPFQF